MDNSTLIPQYKDRTNLFSTSVRLTQKQYADLERLKDVTESPNLGRTLDTIITEGEYIAVKEGKRKPDDFIPQDERKTCTLSFKTNIVFKECLAELQHFYNAPSLSAVCAHAIDWYIRELDAGKAVK